MLFSGVFVFAPFLAAQILPSSILHAPYRATSAQSEFLPAKIEPFIHDYTRARFISTLDPSRLTPSDYQSLSRNTYVALCPRIIWPHDPLSDLAPKSDKDIFLGRQHETPYTNPYLSFVEFSREKGISTPFPDDANGFFYYHRPNNAPPTAGHLRFRITPSADPASWSSGRDLCSPDGLVWKMSLMIIAAFHPKFTALRTLLLTDKLISPELVKQCAKFWKWRGTLGPNTFLAGLEMPFWTSFSGHDRGRFTVINREEHKLVHVRPFFRDLRSRPVDPYTGSAFCQFELHNSQLTRSGRQTIRKAIQNNRPPTRKLVLRVLRIIHSISRKEPDYDGFVNEPKAGELMTIGLGNAKQTWMYDVDTGRVSPAHRTNVWVSAGQLQEDMDGLRLLLHNHADD